MSPGTRASIPRSEQLQGATLAFSRHGITLASQVDKYKNKHHQPNWGVALRFCDNSYFATSASILAQVRHGQLFSYSLIWLVAFQKIRELRRVYQTFQKIEVGLEQIGNKKVSQIVIDTYACMHL